MDMLPAPQDRAAAGVGTQPHLNILFQPHLGPRLHHPYVLFLPVPPQALCVKWSCLRLPWVDLDWLLDISCQITELDLSGNCLPSLPSIIPWGLINLKKLNLSDNHLGELPCVQSSDEIICSRWAGPGVWTRPPVPRGHSHPPIQVPWLNLGFGE